MTWNYYIYNIVNIDLNTVIWECGEDLDIARQKLQEYKILYPNFKLGIQQLHSIARIIK